MALTLLAKELDHRTIGMVVTITSPKVEDKTIKRVVGQIDAIEFHSGGDVGLVVGDTVHEVPGDSFIDVEFNSVTRKLHALFRGLEDVPGFQDGSLVNGH